MKFSRIGRFTLLFILSVAFSFLTIGSQVFAKGSWVLKKQWEENKPLEEEINHHSINITTGSSSGSQSSSFGPGPTYKETGGSSCKGTWTVPPKLMKPGDKIPFTFQATNKGQDSRGSFHFYHSCNVGCQYISRLNADGHVTSGGGCGMKQCSAKIGGGKASNSCSIETEWQVPSGSHGSGMILYLGTYGNAGTGKYAFKYVYDKNAERQVVKAPPEDSGGSEPLNPSKCSWLEQGFIPEHWDEECINIMQPLPPSSPPETPPPPGGGVASVSTPFVIPAECVLPKPNPQTYSLFQSIRPLFGHPSETSTRGFITNVAQPHHSIPFSVPGDNGPHFDPGQYNVYVAQSNPNGTQIKEWKSYGPYDLLKNKKYLATLEVTNSQEFLQSVTNPEDTLLRYGPPEKDKFRAFGLNMDHDNWLSVCIFLWVFPLAVALMKLITPI